MSTLPSSPLHLNPAITGSHEPAPASTVAFPFPPTDLPSEGGENLESDWHRKEINLLIESIYQHWKDRTDFYAGGNMFIYFSEEQARNRDFRGPDFYVVKNVDGRRMRPFWATWLEAGRYPDVIIELTSPTIMQLDLGIKKEVYQSTFHTQEYFCYDHESRQLQGWKLENKVYRPISPDANGRLQCTELGLSVGTWTGHFQGFDEIWLRFFDPAGNVVLNNAEAANLNAQHEREKVELFQAEIARLKAELEANQKRD